jgi:hypothetical protein
VPQLTFWRFVQGMLLPPIFTVTVAYIGDEWPPADIARVAGFTSPDRASADFRAVSFPACWPT